MYFIHLSTHAYIQYVRTYVDAYILTYYTHMQYTYMNTVHIYIHAYVCILFNAYYHTYTHCIPYKSPCGFSATEVKRYVCTYSRSAPSCAADTDECSSGDHLCEHFCINTVGNYHCSCRSGYKISEDGHSCEGVCVCTLLVYTCFNCYNLMNLFIRTYMYMSSHRIM